MKAAPGLGPRCRWCGGTCGGDRVGRRALPYLIIFQIVLPLLAPFIDVIALYDLLLGGTRAPEYWLLFTVFQVLIGAVALKLDGERLRTLWSLPLQQFLYRQFMYLVVIQACFSAVVGERLRWHKLARVGGLEVAGPAVELASAQ